MKTTATRRALREVKDLPKPDDVHAVSWFVLYCNVQSEARAAWRLVEKGFSVYLPISTKWVRPKKAKELKQMSRPAFVRYLFVGMPPRSSWWDIRSTDGVESVVCNNLAPVRITPDQIEDMMIAQDLGAFDVERPEEMVRLRIGEHVVMMSGPFEGYTATVKKAPKRVTQHAVVELMGRMTKVPLDMLRVVA